MNEILNLFLPTACIACKKLGGPFCTGCQSTFPLSARATSRNGIPGFAFSRYGELAAEIINAIKEAGQTSLIGPVAGLVAKQWPEALRDAILVPIPSSPSNYKRRGYQHTLKLANALEKRIPGTKTCVLLRSENGRLDQASLNLDQRITNVNGAFRADLRGFQVDGRPIVLIDDVATTGATISAAATALNEAGIEQVSFCVLAETGSKSAHAGSV